MTKIINPRGLRKHFINCFIIICLSLFFSADLRGAVIPVTPVDNIQTVINGANSGDTIQFGAGTYTQEFEIVSKNLNLVGAGIGNTIIFSPATVNLLNSFTYTGPSGPTTYVPIIMVENATVNISALTVDGDNQGSPPGPDRRFTGIGYHNAGGIISTVHVTNIQDNNYPIGYQEGYGILVANDTGTNTVTVQGNTIDNFQKTGILTIGPGLTFTVSGNTVTGNTPFSPANANGIELFDGATGLIHNNTVTNMIGSTTSSVGILAFDAVGLTISDNTVNNNDEGIYCFDVGDNLTISGNTCNTNNDAGITVANPDILTIVTTTITDNIVTDNVNSGIYLMSNLNDIYQMANNQFINGAAGLIVQGNTITGPVVTMNADSFTGTTGYYIQEITAPNDIWPSTSNVSFDGLVSGHITFAEFNQILTKIFDKHNDATLGLVLDYIIPLPPILININPPFGPPTGGGTLLINGANFISSNTLVFFGAVPATNVVVHSDNTVSVTIPPGTGTVDVRVVTPFGTTPIVIAGQYTYITTPTAPLPPSNFRGTLKKNKFLNKTEFGLTATWDPSPTVDVVSYVIFKNGNAVERISAGSPLIFVACLNSKSSVSSYTIVATDSSGQNSIPIPLIIR